MRAPVIIVIAIVVLAVGLWWHRRAAARVPAAAANPSYFAMESTSQSAGSVQPRVMELSDVDRARLDRQRQVVLAMLKQEYGTEKLTRTREDLLLLQRLLNDKVFAPTQTFELQSMGIVFGDVLANELGLRWVMISDEYGTDPTLLLPGSHDPQYFFHALTMISKRVEQGQDSNVTWLFGVVEAEVKRRSQPAQGV